MKFLKFKNILILTIILACFIVAISTFIHNLLSGLPDISNLENYTPSISTKIFDRNGNLITELYIERRVLVPLKEIPLNLQNAFLAIEDSEFFNHWGISTKGILRAAFINTLTGKVKQGGSTITQQLSKTLFLTSKKTLLRKIKELVLTIELERKFTKEEIFQLYLNQIYFGAGGYGAESASKIYFGKSVRDLNLAECALIAGLPKAPNYYSPLRNPERAKIRRSVVLARMRELNFITKEQEEQANNEPIPTKKFEEKEDTGYYFIEYLRILLEPKYGVKVLHKGGLRIYTTLDIKMQKAAEKALRDSLADFDYKQLAVFQKEDEYLRKVQGAILAIDPKSGAIRVMVGGRDFEETKFNRATQAKRQAGSSFKTFLYTAAIDSKIVNPATMVNDEPMVFVFDGNNWNLVSRKITDIEIFAEKMTPEELIDPMKIWYPVNYGGKYKGPVTIRQAIYNSLNTCAVDTIEKVTPQKVIDYARKMGITSPLVNSLSLALGSSDVTLQEMVSAFSTLASGGIQTEPYFITKVLDKNGKVLEYHVPKEREVLSQQTSYIMTNLLRSVVEKGSGFYARNLGRPCAGKTGTSNNSADAWFVGYTPELVAGVWVGYDDRFSLGKKSTGGTIACPIWTSFMKEALKGYPVSDFVQPKQGIEYALIDPKTGLLALSKTPNAYIEAFLEGTAPKKYINQDLLFNNSNSQSNEEDQDQEPEGY